MDPAAAGIDWREWWEIASYVVTVIGLPLAILVFVYERRKERQSDDDELYQKLSTEYAEFLKLVLANADLRLMSHVPITDLTDEQRELLEQFAAQSGASTYEPDPSFLDKVRAVFRQ